MKWQLSHFKTVLSYVQFTFSVRDWKHWRGIPSGHFIPFYRGNYALQKKWNRRLFYWKIMRMAQKHITHAHNEWLSAGFWLWTKLSWLLPSVTYLCWCGINSLYTSVIGVSFDELPSASHYIVVCVWMKTLSSALKMCLSINETRWGRVKGSERRCDKYGVQGRCRKWPSVRNVTLQPAGSCLEWMALWRRLAIG